MIKKKNFETLKKMMLNEIQVYPFVLVLVAPYQTAALLNNE